MSVGNAASYASTEVVVAAHLDDRYFMTLECRVCQFSVIEH